MPSTARQLRQPPTIEAIERGPYFADVLTKVAASKKVGSSSKDYKGIVKEVINKKKILTTIKI